jgi:hypothetical protein
LLLQSLRDGSNGPVVSADPRKQLFDHPRLVEDYLIVGRVRSVHLANIAVAEGSMRQRAHRPMLSGMSASSTRALDDFGPLIFRNDSLNLHEELILGCLLDVPIEKYHLHTGMAEFLE